MEFAVEAVSTSGQVGLIATAFTFGLQHGIDWDHIAAITDITSSQSDARRSFRLAGLYALGHALVVLILGAVAIAFGDLLPESFDATMEKVVGVTLVLLGGYVFYSLIRHGREFRMQSRWMLVLRGVRRLGRRLGRRTQVVHIEHDHEHHHEADHEHHHENDHVAGHVHPPADRAEAPVAAEVTRVVHRHAHSHTHTASMPVDPFSGYGPSAAIGIGMLHGVGAETPTQVLLFIAAAGSQGTAVSLLVLVAFIVGLLVTNTVIAATSAFGFFNASRSWPVYTGVAVVTGVFSLVVGVLFLLGKGSLLPGFFGT